VSRALARNAQAVVLALLLAGCASAPVVDIPEPPAGDAIPPPPAAHTLHIGQQLFDMAALQLGAPYRFGGEGPDAFDCSGLVLFSHSRLGIRVPRTAAAQREAARPVPLEALRAGDLLFFRMRGAEIDHVGIYDGAGFFLHAPGRGRGVERARFELPWYRERFVGAGRFWIDAAASSHAR
jgi:cell wall-associated NlpC family hydrolase